MLQRRERHAASITQQQHRSHPALDPQFYTLIGTALGGALGTVGTWLVQVSQRKTQIETTKLDHQFTLERESKADARALRDVRREHLQPAIEAAFDPILRLRVLTASEDSPVDSTRAAIEQQLQLLDAKLAAIAPQADNEARMTNVFFSSLRQALDRYCTAQGDERLERTEGNITEPSARALVWNHLYGVEQTLRELLQKLQEPI